MDKLSDLFGRIFDIRAGEWLRLLLLYALAFTLNVSVVWGQAASDALFLQRIGVSYLPLMFIADALVTLATILVYSSFVDRISNMRLMIAIALLGSLLLMGSRVGLAFELRPVYPLLYLLDRALKAIITVHAWSFIADFYDAQTAKRHFPLIGSGSRTSGILAGLLILPLTRLFYVENLILAWVAALLISAWLAWLTPRLVKSDNTTKPGQQERQGVIENLHTGLSFVAHSRYLRLLSMAAIVGTMLLYLLEYYSQRVFVQHFETAAELASFYGLLGAAADLITLPIQMFLLSRVVTSLGVGNANLIFPSLSALSYGLLTLLPSLPTAAFARVNRTALRSAFRTPIDGLLFNAIPPTIKGRARAFVGGLLIPLGTLLAGLLLLMASYGWLPELLLLGIGFAVTAVYLGVSLRIRREYSQSMASLLEEDQLALLRISQDAFEQVDPATLQRLYQWLDESEDDSRRLFLAEMLYEMQGRGAIPRLQRLAAESSAEVRAGIIQLLTTNGASDPALRQFAIDGLADQDAGVRLVAVRALANMPGTLRDRSLLTTLLGLLDDEELRVQAEVLPTLIASQQPDIRQPAVVVLDHWFSVEASSQQRALALRILARLGDERLLETLRHHLSDPSPSIRRQAIEQLDELMQRIQDETVVHAGIQALRAMLDDEDEGVRLAAVTSLGHLRTAEADQALLLAMHDHNFEVRRRACLVSDHLPVSLLEAALDNGNEYLAECAMFLLAQRNYSSARRRIVDLMESLVVDAFRLYLHCLPLQTLSTQGCRLFLSSLQEEAQDRIKRAFWLLSALSSEQKADAIFRSLQSESSTKRSNAIEALESFTRPRLARLLMPLVSGDTAAIADASQQLLELKPPALRQVLCRTWPALGRAFDDLPSDEDIPTAPCDGWRAAVTMFAMLEMDRSMIDEQQPLMPATFRDALQMTSRQGTPLEREVALVVLARLEAQPGAERMERPMMMLIEKVAFLKNIPFFRDMNISQLRILAGISEEVIYEAGQQIYAEGEYGDTLYIVVRGRVAIQRENRRGRRPSLTRLATLGPNDYFAEMSIFDKQPHSTDAVALETTTLLQVRQAPLIALIERQTDLAMSLLRVLSQRLREANTAIADRTQEKPKELLDVFDKLE